MQMQHSLRREIPYKARPAVFGHRLTPAFSLPGLSLLLSAAPNFLPSGLYRRLRFLTESALLKKTNAARGLMQNPAITAGRELALPDGFASPHPENLVACFYAGKNRQCKKESQARTCFHSGQTASGGSPGRRDRRIRDYDFCSAGFFFTGMISFNPPFRIFHIFNWLNYMAGFAATGLKPGMFYGRPKLNCYLTIRKYIE